MDLRFFSQMKSLVRLAASPKLTLGCLVAAMVLVFLGTIAQAYLGTFAAQEFYFRSWFLVWKPPHSSVGIPYFPGGYFIGLFLFLNLIATGIVQFSLKLKKLGLLLIHAGLCLFIIGEIVSGVTARESQMEIRVGEGVDFSEDMREVELVVRDITEPGVIREVKLSATKLTPGKERAMSDTPFSVTLKKYYSNADLTVKRGDRAPAADRGVGAKVVVEPKPMIIDDEEVNNAVVVLGLHAGQNSLGTWLLSNGITTPERFLYRGKEYEMMLRQKRYEYPFRIELTDFVHETYPGTDIPKNFTSSIRVLNADGELDRQALITMNHPLRYQGLTIFQASYGDNDRISVFQVVDNPVRFFPYLSSALVGVGLVFQFIITLFRRRGGK